MATISKFYMHDAATSNTGTMPTGAFIAGAPDTTGDATGARTARDANGTIGVAQTSATITSTANTSFQTWGLRRFVSAPLAATSFAITDGNWTFSTAGSESSTNHNQSLTAGIYCWRPSTGLQVGTVNILIGLAESGTTQTALSGTSTWTGSVSILDGDILVFEVSDEFTQAMATAYTSSFFYDGTTEASTTSCATFVTPPSALTLFTAAPTGAPQPLHQSVPFFAIPSRPS